MPHYPESSRRRYLVEYCDDDRLSLFVYTFSPGRAKAVAQKAAREAGFPVKFTDWRARQASETIAFDEFPDIPRGEVWDDPNGRVVAFAATMIVKVAPDYAPRFTVTIAARTPLRARILAQSIGNDAGFATRLDDWNVYRAPDVDDLAEDAAGHNWRVNDAAVLGEEREESVRRLRFYANRRQIADARRRESDEESPSTVAADALA